MKINDFDLENKNGRYQMDYLKNEIFKIKMKKKSISFLAYFVGSRKISVKNWKI